MERGKIIFKKLPRCCLEGRVDEYGSFLEFSSSDLENAAKIQIKNIWDIYSISTGSNENFFINSSMIKSYIWMVLIEGGEELSQVGATDWPYFCQTPCHFCWHCGSLVTYNINLKKHICLNNVVLEDVSLLVGSDRLKRPNPL